MSDDGSFDLRWKLHEETRTVNLKSLWDNEDFLDVTIACDDDQIGAHKVILSAASPFFKTILKRNPHSHPLLYLRGTNMKDMRALLDFIYSGETQVPQEELEEFMALATSLKVEGLVEGLSGTDDGFQFATTLDHEIAKKKDKKVNGKKAKRFSKIVEEEQIILQLDEIKEEKNTKLRKMDEHVQYIEYSEKMGENIVEKYEFAEENESFQLQNISNTSLSEYELKVTELISKSEMDWNCRACSYSTKNKSHAREHTEKHITGFSFECINCDKTFNQKRNLRSHKYSCKKQKLE